MNKILKALIISAPFPVQMRHFLHHLIHIKHGIQLIDAFGKAEILMSAADKILICVSSLILQETVVLGSVGSVNYPLPVHRFLDDRIRGQPKLYSCARSPL